ncbi:hypothetical protein Tco_1417559 [Tanacetum coccineum]
MVAYLKKPTGSEGFQEIVDFLNGSHIRYALTTNPTIYVSLIEKFWQTATVKTVDNGEQEITATVDGKEFTVTKASVRRHLQLADVEGISVLPTTEIFDQLSLMGYVLTDDKLTFQKGKFSPQWRFLIHTILHCLSPKKTAWEQFSSNIATAIICLATNRTFNFSKLIFDVAEGEGSRHPSEPQPPHSIAQPTNEEPTPTVASSSHKKTQTPRQALKEVIELPQTSEPISNVPDEAVYEEWDDREIGTSGSPRCQEAMGGSNAQIRSKKVPTQSYDSPLPRVNTLGSDEGSMTLHELTVMCTQLSNKVESLETELKQTKQTYGAAFTKLIKKGRKINEIDQDPDITLVQHDAEIQGLHGQEMEFETEVSTSKDISIVDTLVAIMSTRPRTTSVVIRDVEKEPRRATPIPIVQSQDKGKGKMVEPEPTLKNPIKAQIQRDAEIAQGLFEEEQAQFEREQRIARERATEQEAKDATLIEQMEDIQARMDADELLAERLQQEEREQFTIEEKSRMLVEMIAERKRFFAAQRAEQIRNKPTTRKLYEREQKWINDFVPIDSEVVKDNRKEDDDEKEALRVYLDIISRDDESVNVESLATKGDGSTKSYKIFTEMLDDFDRQDVLDLYRLVKERFKTTSPEGYDRLLWGDLITVFEPSEDDDIWKTQQDYTLIRWRLFDSCGVHVLLMDTGIAIHILIEKTCPLIQAML